MNKKIKIFIVDDSLIYRSQIKKALASLSYLQVTGVASSGKIALDKIDSLPIDLLILDMEMPEMDGISFLRELNKKEYSFQVLVFSSSSKAASHKVMEALNLGAIDFITKPSREDQTENQGPEERILNILRPRIDAIFLDRTTRPKQSPSKKPTPGTTNKINNKSSSIFDIFNPKVIVIGSSTGGPTVLEGLFSKLNQKLSCPVLIAQHMPPIFTASLAERLEKLSGIKTKEAENNEEIIDGVVYIAPGDFHFKVKKNNGKVIAKIDQGPKVNSVRPAVDHLFESASEVYGQDCLGIILTGMGKDGKDGAISIKKNKGLIIIQEKESCVVYGMPGAVEESGAWDQSMSPDQISKYIKNRTKILNL